MRFYKKSIIKRNDEEAYLIRYSLFSCRFFSIKIHKIILSDYDCLHDHPWAFISFIFKGGYVETLEKDGKKISRLYGAPSILYRPAKSIHKLTLFQPAWTFIITFKKVRRWGFHTPKGWIFWKDYQPSNTCE